MTGLGCRRELVLTVRVLLFPQITDESGRKPRAEEGGRREPKGVFSSTNFSDEHLQKQSHECQIYF